MIRAIRLTPMCLDDPGGLLAGWNVAPAAAYTLSLAPGSSACAVMLWNTDMSVLIATGAAVVGASKPVTLVAQSGQSIAMQDDELGWHLLLTTTGTEAARTIRLDPVVDLADDVHPLYQDDDLALARATAAIDAATHYVDELAITCPLGGAALGQIVSAPVDGETMTGQVEAITWTGTPDGHADALTVLRYVPMTPDPPVAPPAPPSVTDDAGVTDAMTAASGNVLDNDGDDLTVVAVEGLGSLVGVTVAGSNGGEFTIAADGAWTFDPSGDFSTLTGTDTAETSVTYHASDGVSEAMGTLTITVSSADAQPWTPAAITTALWLDYLDDATITLVGGKVSAWADKSGNNRHASMATDSLRPVVDNGIYFADKRLNFASLTNVTGFCFYVVAARAGTQDHNTLVTISPHGASSGNVARARVSWRTGQSYALGFSGSAGIGPNISPATNIDEFNIFGWRQSLSSPTMFNGSQFAASVSPAADSNGGVYALGTDGWNPGYFRIKELVAVATYSADTDAKIFGYLAHRYDLAAKLPSDHPYKSAAPTL